MLSEMARAANEFSEALLINPKDRTEIASMIDARLEMYSREQEERMTAMQEHVRSYDVVTWARAFFKKLQLAK